MTGYPLVQQGRYKEGLAMMRRGLKRAPLNPLYWKTYLLTLLRSTMPASKAPNTRTECRE